MKRNIALGSIFLLAGFSLYLFVFERTLITRANTVDSSKEIIDRLSSATKVQAQPANSLNQIVYLDRIEIYVQRWLAIRGDSDGSAEALLRKEIIEQLLCSEELFRLGERMSAVGCAHFFTGILHDAENLFKGSKAEDARNSLIQLSKSFPDQHKFKQEVGRLFLVAGQSATDSEWGKFFTAITGEHQQQAFIGRFIAIAATRPGEAVSSALSLLDRGLISSSSAVALEAIANAIPDDADFGTIEKLLPPDNWRGTHDVTEARGILLNRMAAKDVAVAANYVVENKERIEPSNMKKVVETFIIADLKAGLAWIQELPQGPYFDNAASVACHHMAEDYPNEAKELALQIQDLKVRAECLRDAEHFLELMKPGAMKK